MSERTIPDFSITTIPAGRAFLPALAEAILAGHLPRRDGPKPSPLELSRMTLLLPTQRAAREVGEAFLAASGGAALLLPQVRFIAAGQDDLELMTRGDADLFNDGVEIAPAIAALERRLVLTQLVLQWARAVRWRVTDAGAPDDAAGAATPAQAANLAAELGRLMDMVETEGVSLAGLETLVPEDYSAHWNQTLDFLRIVVEAWPAFLAAAGKLSPADRRNRVIEAEAARLLTLPPAGPVIIAGVTGSIPATIKLMRAVARLPNGAIVLPALDGTLSAEDAAQIRTHHPEHPQFGLAKLLDAFGLVPADVPCLSGQTAPAAARLRHQLIAEAMRPAPTLDRWQNYITSITADALDAACAGLALIEAPTADHEAEAIALILRHAVETPGQTAALVSPDRMLARRVVNRLETLGVAVDDSAGRPLAKSPPGAFLNLVIEAWASAFAPIALMSLLKHPLLRLGMEVRDVRRAGRALELMILRGPYLGRGLDGVRAALDVGIADANAGKRRHRAARSLRDEDYAAARTLVDALEQAFAPLSAVTTDSDNGIVALQAWARAHGLVAEMLAATGEPDNPLWDGDAGLAARRFFAEVGDETMPAPAVAGSDYPELYRSLTSSITVRPRVPVHPRISIWGPFEARLQQPTVLVLGGLVDGIWPASADPGPWLNRPMRAALGLPSPEEKIGQAAHDFVSLMGAERVYLTRAGKIDGVPTVPSRWLLRLLALLDGAAARTGLTARQRLMPDLPWLAWAHARDLAPKAEPARAPAPLPSLAWRPRQLPITAIERWLANPYAIYAQHILRLEKLDPIGGVPGAALKGQIVHDALHRFAQRFPTALPDDIAARLLEDASAAMQAYAAHPRVAAFWLPRFERFAHWFAETEPARRSGVSTTIPEVEGSMVLAAPGGPFTLKARADRMDIGARGLAITDYKTGRAPANQRVLAGLAPQLPLEAAIALAGGFTGIATGITTGIAVTKIAQLAYIRVSGGEPAGEEYVVANGNSETVAQTTLAGLARLIARFDDPATPYRAVRRAAYASSYAYDDYAHLARVAEWSVGGDDGDEE